MRYIALATDYDGTLAHDGRVPAEAIDALERLRGSGRRTLLVTGRELPDLQRVFDRLDLFDRVVAENGALLYCPETREERLLCEPADERLVSALRRRDVKPLSVGRGIVATWEPNETAVLDCIRDLGLELHVVFNKGAVMVLPSGVNKATGLTTALIDLKLSPHNVVGVGDAENDHAFLMLCECAVAVANALPAVKETCDHVTQGARGEGVVEVIEEVLRADLTTRETARRHIALGESVDGETLRLAPHGDALLLAGPSGSGKSTLAGGCVERLAGDGYQFCLIDPEGDYGTLECGTPIGDVSRAPGIEEVLRIAEDPHASPIVSLLGIALEERPAFLAALIPRLHEMRSRWGRPHWIIVDEAHHMLSPLWSQAGETLPRDLLNVMMITVHPDRLGRVVLGEVTTVVATGDTAGQTVEGFARAVGREAPAVPAQPEEGMALLWPAAAGASPVWFRIAPAASERLRHRRKYAEGELGEDKSFYFRGPDAKLNLRAQNLIMFMQLADGIDDDTWQFHLRADDYSRWIAGAIKDDELAREVEGIERDEALSAAESRSLVRRAIESRYTMPD